MIDAYGIEGLFIGNERAEIPVCVPTICSCTIHTDTVFYTTMWRDEVKDE